MALTFAKSVRLGGVRFNFSGSGIGVSVGIPGLRIGTGPRGAYISGGIGGFRYRKSLALAGSATRPSSVRRPAASPSTDPSEPYVPSQAENISRTVEHNAKDVLQLTDSTDDELLRSINEQYKKWRRWPWVLGVTIFATWQLTLAESLPPWVATVVLVLGLTVTAWTAWRDRMRKITVLFYDPDASFQEKFAFLEQAARTASSAKRLRSVAQTSTYRDRKYTAGATTGVKFENASLTIGQAPDIRANVDVPLLKAGRTLLAFYPDRILAFQGKSVGAISYDRINAASGHTRFVENEAVPPDATVVDRTWQYVNKSGGPDRRFKNNREYPVCRYSELVLTTSDGLDLRFMASRAEAFDTLAAALNQAAEGDAAALVSAPKRPSRRAVAM